MKTIRFFFLLAALSLVAMPSCIKKPSYPSEPVIEYKNFLRYGNPADPDSVDLVLSFTDNEGDIGLDPSDTFGVFKKGNLYMIYLYDSAHIGNFIPFDDSLGLGQQFDTFKLYYRVPPLLPAGDPSEPMKGLIYARQSKKTGFSVVHDTIKYEVFLYDKALHKSNVIRTPVIIF